MGVAWQTGDASATKGGRAVIVRCVMSGSAGMLARACVMQRPLARGTEGVTMWAGASVWIRSQVSGVKNARRAALALNVKARANQEVRALRTDGVWAANPVSALKDLRVLSADLAQWISLVHTASINVEKGGSPGHCKFWDCLYMFFFI